MDDPKHRNSGSRLGDVPTLTSAGPDAHAAASAVLAGRTVGVAAISLSGGGAERQAALWAHAAAGQGAAVRVFSLEAAERAYELPPGTSLEVAGKASRRDLGRIVLALRRFAADCDVVAAFQPFMGLLCMAGGTSRYVLVTGQDPRHWRDTSRVPRPVMRAGFGRALAATAPSRGLIDCHRALGLRPRADRWMHVPNVVDERAFAATAGAAERRGVLFVGRLVPEKEPLLALRAAASAGLPITFLGDGPLREDIRTAARREGVQDLVTLHPFTPSPWEHFARHRVLVVTSRYETFANVIVESLAAGTPVVSVDCDFGPREILAGAACSRLVAPGDEAALADALRAVADRAPDAAEAQECRAIAGRYTADALAPAIADALRVATC